VLYKEGKKNLSNSADLKLWKGLKSGDRKSLKELHFKYFNELLIYGLKLSNNRLKSVEAIQDIFVYLWDKHLILSEVNNVKAYIFKSFRNKILKNSFSELQYSDELKLSDQEPADLSIEESIIQKDTHKEKRKIIGNILNCLPDKQREIISLRFFHNLSYREISDIVGIEYQSVRNSIHRSIKTIREAFNGEFNNK